MGRRGGGSGGELSARINRSQRGLTAHRSSAAAPPSPPPSPGRSRLGDRRPPSPFRAAFAARRWDTSNRRRSRSVSLHHNHVRNLPTLVSVSSKPLDFLRPRPRRTFGLDEKKTCVSASTHAHTSASPLRSGGLELDMELFGPTS